MVRAGNRRQQTRRLRSAPFLSLLVGQQVPTLWGEAVDPNPRIYPAPPNPLFNSVVARLGGLASLFHSALHLRLNWLSHVSGNPI